MKCALCKKEVELTFLGKLMGTYVKDSKHKKQPICQNCQKTKDVKKEIS